MRIPPFNPYIALVIGVISVSAAAVFVKLADGAPAAIIANYRLLFAVLIMSPIIFTKYRHELQSINKKNWTLLCFAGVFLAIHFILWFESLNYTSVTSSVVLVTMQPLFAFILTYFFFGERFSQGTIISIIIAILGSVIIGWVDFLKSGTALFGDILALLAAILMAAYLILGQQTRNKLSLMTYTFIVYGVSSITLFFYNLIMQHSFIHYPIEYWAIFVALAIIPTLLGQSLFNWAHKWLSPATVSMAIIFEPIGATILAYLILNETVTGSQVLGGTIVVFGLFLLILSTSRKSSVTISKKIRD
ncbi:DMT family transporter [Oceanobacillus bengalensis]|uniref:DMT family transporter n=1 Tax=Oceanobacillus bengalensis TaxID=1435466 RepID=A0A494YRB7_9BACI|nr:DMT family transporter [Oceanobacillus bengalensis]RKQ11824.1 DMT family transporter [Oceanobacillus bengalensis]